MCGPEDDDNVTTDPSDDDIYGWSPNSDPLSWIDERDDKKPDDDN